MAKHLFINSVQLFDFDPFSVGKGLLKTLTYAYKISEVEEKCRLHLILVSATATWFLVCKSWVCLPLVSKLYHLNAKLQI